MIWKISIFSNADDNEPARVGYVEAEDENLAVEITLKSIGHDQKADVTVVREVVDGFPPNQVFWVFN